MHNLINIVITMSSLLIFIYLTKTESSEPIQNAREASQGKAIETIKAKQSVKNGFEHSQNLCECLFLPQQLNSILWVNLTEENDMNLSV